MSSVDNKAHNQIDRSKQHEPTKMQIQHENGVIIQGLNNLLVRLAKCCNPVPGDAIVGYVTKGRGVTIHRADCSNISESDRIEGRVMDVEWMDVSSKDQTYFANLSIYGFNRSGLLNDILQKLNAVSKKLSNISGRVDHNDMAHVRLTVSVKNSQHLNEILIQIKNIPDVYEAKRADQ